MAAGPPQSGGAAGPLGPPAMASQWNPASYAVAVWEWQDELGKWRPYSSKVSTYIEQCMQSYQQQKNTRALANSRSISLGQVDPKLAPYVIDIATLAQFRQDTGTMRYVRKTLYPLDSAPAKGICWEWMNDDGCWTAYETHICIYLEEKLTNGNRSVDLGALGLHYLIDFNSFVQINQATGFKRRVQRNLGAPYPTTPKAGPAHKSTACACHQCLASSHAGPMHRYRHSMINLPTSANYQSSSRISTNNVGYLPYPKPTMTSAKSAPKLNSTWVPSSTPLQLAGPSSANGISIPSVPVQIQKSSSMNQAFAGVTDPEQVVKKYLETVDKPPEEDCIIGPDLPGLTPAAPSSVSRQPGGRSKWRRSSPTQHNVLPGGACWTSDSFSSPAQPPVHAAGGRVVGKEEHCKSTAIATVVTLVVRQCLCPSL
ncbi:PREDICTED: probable E3 ubiquitin-protein ligase DTX2 [Nanorana parkeri]|uniref:probable E3 ubiquitin-protein ligase DTX2 n=1 Tax=Nanorana parkeri TaxID=125878 RepID=UPI0008541B3A|nr:PREDICTED: probable E3 ubiquitin-protein ligase DTX2 [Nanorana parkeri]